MHQISQCALASRASIWRASLSHTALQRLRDAWLQASACSKSPSNPICDSFANVETNEESTDPAVALMARLSARRFVSVHKLTSTLTYVLDSPPLPRLLSPNPSVESLRRLRIGYLSADFRRHPVGMCREFFISLP